MSNGYQRIYPQHGTDRVNAPPGPPPPDPPPPPEPSAATMTLQLDQLKAQVEKYAPKREDTGVHKVNTEALEKAMVAEYARIARTVWKRIRNWAAGLATTAAIGGGGVAAWSANSDAPPRVEPIDVQHTVEVEAKAHTDAIKANAKGVADANEKIRRVTGIVIELGDEQAENALYLGRKLDEISPKARRVEPPAALKLRKKKKESKRLDKRIDDALGTE